MAINDIAKAILAGVALAFLLSGCPSPCVEAAYNFRVRGTFMPEQDSIEVGDTLFFVYSFPKTLQDVNTRQVIDYQGASNIGFTLRVTEFIEGQTLAKGAVGDFNYINLLGKVYNEKSIPSPETVQQLSLIESTDTYDLKIAMIPKKKGIYGLGIGDGISAGRKNGGNCEKATFLTRITNGDNHIHYLEEFFKRPASDTENEKVYCFKVY